MSERAKAWALAILFSLAGCTSIPWGEECPDPTTRVACQARMEALVIKLQQDKEALYEKPR